jgi:hypothetical protein
MLSKEIPAISDIWKTAPVPRSPTEWALQWVWNHPQAAVVLSGMSDCEQVVQNIVYAEKGLPDSLSQTELDLFDKVKAEYGKRIKIPCTGCRYCMPCPSGVSIPECFEMYNTACMFDAPEVAKFNYNIVLGGILNGNPEFASQCQECGECEEKCPQKIPIRDHLKEVVKYFGK